MNQHSSTKLTRIIALCFMTALFAIGASAQIRIGDIKIPLPKNPKNPQPKNPPTTNTNPTTPNPNGNKTPTPNANTRPTANTRVETGATRDQVSEFNKDMAPYRNGMYYLKWWAEKPAGCRELSSIRTALTHGAAFYEIVKQKYPTIENPSWSAGNAEEHLVGDFRRAAENREAITKNCVNQLLSAKLAEKIGSVNDAMAEFGEVGEWKGYVLGSDSFDKAARHAALMEAYKEHYALVGITMPDVSVFAEYDAAHDRLVALANENAGKWVFPPTFRDAMIEAKARGWLKDRHPKSTVVKIGMLHGEWQVNHHRNGIPSGRYKRGYVMFRLPGAQNCLVTSFALEQNYIGGGRFNAEAVTSGLQHSLRMQLCK
ncbi:MAG TPA: hypothetical protein VFX97_11085 [Pyrinomonadaceae bacterium]|nr:hypothetical protein [Pyrinomonadaceae bacterium]